MMDFEHLNDCEQMTSRCTKLAVQSFFEGGCLVTQGWECLYPFLALDGCFLCIQRVSGYAEGMGICTRDGQPSQERGLSVYPIQAGRRLPGKVMKACRDQHACASTFS